MDVTDDKVTETGQLQAGDSSIQPGVGSGAALNSLSTSKLKMTDLSWGGAFRRRQIILGWGLLGLCVVGIIWGSLPGHGWLPYNAQGWEIAVCVGASLLIRFLCGLIVYEYEGFQVAAALVAQRKITPDLDTRTQDNIRKIQKQGALESMFGGRQLILVSTVLLPTVIEASFHPLLPSFQVSDPDYYASLAKVTVKTFSFAVIICILAQLSSQIKAIGGPVAWMRRWTTKHVITSVGFAEKLGLIIPSRLIAHKLAVHHDLDGQPGTVHEWANWWSEKFAVDTGQRTPPPFLLPPDHQDHLMPHKVLNYLLDHRDQPGYLEETVPALLSASMTGLHNTDAKRLWDQIDSYEPTQFRANKPFIWRTGADSLGHIPPHHMWMILFSSSLLILQKSQAPEPEIRALFQQFTAAAFGEKDAFHQYWSNVRKFRIGNPTPLEIA